MKYEIHTKFLYFNIYLYKKIISRDNNIMFSLILVILSNNEQ